MEHYYNDARFVGSWFTFPFLYSNMVKKFSAGSHFVEIGSWKGASTAYMAVEIINSGKDIKFDCIDLWSDASFSEQYKGQSWEIYKTFLKNIEPVSKYVRPIRNDSAETASLYEDRSLDFVFIDGGHEYDEVKKDILAWLPKVKTGGVIAGHDFTGYFPGVVKAVDELFGTGRFSPWYEYGDQCWYLEL